MKKKWTRREFLETGLTGTSMLGIPLAQITSQEAKAALPELEPKLPQLLGAAADEIIPAGDGIPSATEAGVLKYIDNVLGRNPSLQREFQTGLAALEELSRKRFKKSFLRLSRARRVKALKEMEKQARPEFFVNLRDYVYDAYYLQPEVWKLIGYEF